MLGIATWPLRQRFVAVAVRTRSTAMTWSDREGDSASAKKRSLDSSSNSRSAASCSSGVTSSSSGGKSAGYAALVEQPNELNTHPDLRHACSCSPRVVLYHSEQAFDVVVNRSR